MVRDPAPSFCLGIDLVPLVAFRRRAFLLFRSLCMIDLWYFLGGFIGVFLLVTVDMGFLVASK